MLRFAALLLFFLLLFDNYGFAQTIINTEKLMSQDDSLAFSVEFNYSGNRGNAMTNKLDFAPNFINIGTKSDIKIFGAYSILSAGEESIFYSAFIHGRHNYKFSERLKSFAFYQLQFNEVLLLQRRSLYGFGGRYGIINRDTLRFDLGVGSMYESELLDVTALEPFEVAKTNFLRLSIFGSFHWETRNGIQINNVIYYQPHFSNVKDFRLLVDYSLMFKVLEKLNFISTLTYRFDSDPPSALRQYDLNINFGIRYSLSK